LLPVENPGYIFVRESATTMLKKATSLFTKKKGSSSSKTSTTNFFEEALSFRVSSEHRGGHGTAEEEQHFSPRWHKDHMKLVYEVHRTSWMYGGAARPTSPLDTIIRSTSTCSVVFQWIYHHDGGGGEEAHSP
jgi:hypothetical protein